MTLYHILQVGESATTAEIRKAYLSRAKATHPDKAGDHYEFQLTQHAYEVLRDPQQRRVYDHCLTLPRPSWTETVEPLQVRVPAYPEELYVACVKTVTIQRRRTCPHCWGQSTRWYMCWECHGTGWRAVHPCACQYGYKPSEDPCRCSQGYTWVTKRLQINMQRQVEVRFPEWGHEGLHQKGELVIQLVFPDSSFELVAAPQGFHWLYRQPVSVLAALTQIAFTFHHPSGEEYTCAVEGIGRWCAPKLGWGGDLWIDVYIKPPPLHQELVDLLERVEPVRPPDPATPLSLQAYRVHTDPSPPSMSAQRHSRTASPVP
jgi:DnaJ-class molecular chaperone